MGRLRVRQRSGVGACPEVAIEQREAEIEQVLGIRPQVAVATMLRAGSRAREPRAVLAETYLEATLGGVGGGASPCTTSPVCTMYRIKSEERKNGHFKESLVAQPASRAIS